eukprot:9090178-Pyramimonas_sp.AAC.1
MAPPRVPRATPVELVRYVAGAGFCEERTSAHSASWIRQTAEGDEARTMGALAEGERGAGCERGHCLQDAASAIRIRVNAGFHRNNTNTTPHGCCTIKDVQCAI